MVEKRKIKNYIYKRQNQTSIQMASSNNDSLFEFTDDTKNFASFNFGTSTSAISEDFVFGKTTLLNEEKPMLSHSNLNILLFEDTLLKSASCASCSQNFSENYIPKFLGCGHSTCSVCLAACLDSNKMCSICSKSLLLSTVEEYTTNLQLLNLSKSVRQYVGADHHIVCSLQSLKSYLEIKKESLSKSIENRTLHLNTITDDITKIEQLIDKSKKSEVTSETKDLIKEVQNHVDDVEKVLNLGCMPIAKQTYSLGQYKNAKQFFYDLSIRLYKGETIYACELVDGKLKCGKIEFDEDRIIIHALTLFTVNKSAAIVSFRDVKKCIPAENILTFIKIGDQTFYFKIIDSSIQALQFIKLCTGETGSVLLGGQVNIANKVLEKSADLSDSTMDKNVPPSTINDLDFNQDSLISAFDNAHEREPNSASHTNAMSKLFTIQNYMNNSRKAEGCIDYNLDANSRQIYKYYEKGDVVLQSGSQGKYRVYKCIKRSSLKNIIGILQKIFPLNSEDSELSFIADCGIVCNL